MRKLLVICTAILLFVSGAARASSDTYVDAYFLDGQHRAQEFMRVNGIVVWTGHGKWIQAASRENLAEAIQIAAAISVKTDDTVAVIRALNGWYAVLLGPYTHLASLDDRLHDYIEMGLVPKDSFLKDGTKLTEMMWANPAWEK